ncbi:hypothetical protein LPB137_02220 [Poseidonibacter parvus]|uniref:Uncharacterized protein n=1 Tax=Poseidonibacter parvus TaxID=1850254 RepID=A0A1P8KJK5_9BACT|nr:hypothetical protein [Poseidonibacter parvus]APW64742.1 hypothetical protein LPB137_02220 [Poseidonibacter parvus]
MALRNNDRLVIQRVIDKNSGTKKKKKVVQLSIKIDENIDDALYTLSKSLNISKNKLIEDIFLESGIVQEVDENYTKVR